MKVLKCILVYGAKLVQLFSSMVTRCFMGEKAFNNYITIDNL